MHVYIYEYVCVCVLIIRYLVVISAYSTSQTTLHVCLCKYVLLFFTFNFSDLYFAIPVPFAHKYLRGVEEQNHRTFDPVWRTVLLAAHYPLVGPPTQGVTLLQIDPRVTPPLQAPIGGQRPLLGPPSAPCLRLHDRPFRRHDECDNATAVASFGGESRTAEDREAPLAPGIPYTRPGLSGAHRPVQLKKNVSIDLFVYFP